MLLPVENTLEDFNFASALSCAPHSGYNCKTKCILHSDLCFLNFSFRNENWIIRQNISMSKMTIGIQYNTYYEIYGYYFNSGLSSIATVFAKNLGMNLSS